MQHLSKQSMPQSSLRIVVSLLIHHAADRHHLFRISVERVLEELSKNCKKVSTVKLIDNILRTKVFL